MKNYFTIIAVILSSMVIWSCSSAPTDYTHIIKNSISQSLESRRSVEQKISLSDNLFIPVIFDTTAKGNGTININGLLIRVFDQHDDGVIFKNDYLGLQTKDQNSDGISELIFTGILVHTGEKETEPKLLEPVTAIYSLNCKTGFIESIGTPSLFIEIYNKQANRINCK